MADIVVLIATTPVPTILAIGGLLLLLLGFSDGPVAGISIPEERDRLASIIGGLFLFVGLAFYTLPLFLVSPNVELPEDPTSGINEESAINESPLDAAEEAESLSLLEEAADWPLVYQDNFETDRGIWEIGELSFTNFQATISIEQGQYLWNLDILNENVQFPVATYQSVAEVELANKMYLGVDVRYISGDPELIRYGIVFRRQGDNFYLFRIERGEVFSILLRQDGESIDLVREVVIPNFNQGDTIRLGIITDQFTYSFFINDSFVGQIEDDRLTLGNLGLSSFSFTDYSVAFDNIEIRSPD